MSALHLSALLESLKAARHHLNAELRIAAKAGLQDYAAALMREGAEIDRLVDEASASVLKLSAEAPADSPEDDHTEDYRRELRELKQWQADKDDPDRGDW
jgi:uncharacterized protein YicC (UPF0701 family)